MLILPATRPAQTMTGAGVLWSSRRDIQNGIALVNPATTSRIVIVGAGYRWLSGAQDAAVNDGSSASEITLGPKDAIVLRRDSCARKSEPFFEYGVGGNAANARFEGKNC